MEDKQKKEEHTKDIKSNHKEEEEKEEEEEEEEEEESPDIKGSRRELIQLKINGGKLNGLNSKKERKKEDEKDKDKEIELEELKHPTEREKERDEREREIGKEGNKDGKEKEKRKHKEKDRDHSKEEEKKGVEKHNKRDKHTSREDGNNKEKKEKGNEGLDPEKVAATLKAQEKLIIVKRDTVDHGNDYVVPLPSPTSSSSRGSSSTNPLFSTRSMTPTTKITRKRVRQTIIRAKDPAEKKGPSCFKVVFENYNARIAWICFGIGWFCPVVWLFGAACVFSQNKYAKRGGYACFGGLALCLIVLAVCFQTKE